MGPGPLSARFDVDRAGPFASRLAPTLECVHQTLWERACSRRGRNCHPINFLLTEDQKIAAFGSSLYLD
ncbi:hypothetical protein PspCFBP13508_04440 [Pseudomonas sp. CFBP13508]|nr:hypothetical protein PspCFBP13508_04440 [Pseudomonas sp. CFBP13508]